MTTQPTETETTIENATPGDVRPGDHLVWEWSRQEADRLVVTRREGTAHLQGENGDWCTKSGMWITSGMDKATLTIRRPKPNPLPTKPGSIVVATEVRELEGEWVLFLSDSGAWYSVESINGYHWHTLEHITAGAKARVLLAGEKISPRDVRKGDRVRLVLDKGDEVTVTVKHVNQCWIEAHHDAYGWDIIRAAYLLHREEGA